MVKKVKHIGTHFPVKEAARERPAAGLAGCGVLRAGSMFMSCGCEVRL
ncbi:MAG TPA: hypothetical protein PLU95_12155 [Syntrophales bacterium]|nr:hypothetical protein [Syntrophales bacterium]HPX80852.1 hypothetical protein [Syntrophales bacterium]